MIAKYNFKAFCLFCIFFCLYINKTLAQHECHFSFGIAENFNYAYFLGDGKTNHTITTYASSGSPQSGYSDPVIVNLAKYTISPGHSLEGGIPDNNDIAKFLKIFNPSLLFELQIRPSLWFCTGLQIEEKRYDVTVNDLQNGPGNTGSQSFLNVELPFYLKHCTKLPHKWEFFELAGFSINFATLSQYISDEYEEFSASTHGNPYPLFSLGGGITKTLGKDGNKISVEAIYSKGFTNVVNAQADYNYFYGTPIPGSETAPIGSNGTGWRLGIRYTFSRIRKHTDENNPVFKSAEILPIAERKTSDNIPVVTVDSSKVILCIYDDLKVDGHKISVQYNDSMIANNISSLGIESCFNLSVRKKGVNYLIIHAMDEGQVKSNTLQLSIFDGKTTQKLNVQTNLQSSGAVKIIYK